MTSVPPRADVPVPERSVLLVEPDREQLTTLTRVLEQMGLVVESHTHVPENLNDSGYDLVVLEIDRLPTEARERLLTSAKSRYGMQPPLLFSSNGSNRDELITLFSRRTLKNLLARNGTIDLGDFHVTVQKILEGDIFGVDRYFRSDSVRRSFVVHRASDKDALIAAAETFAAEQKVHPRFVSQLSTVVDELMTNAVYNAPIDRAGNRRFASLPRTAEVVLDPGEEVQFTFICDGERLGVVADDPFGSLRPEDVQSYLAKCFRRGDDQIDVKPGGAGLGLYYAFEALSHFIVNISPGKKTQVIGLIIDVQSGFKTFARRSKSMNIFVQP